jgi:hypothetical protein
LFLLLGQLLLQLGSIILDAALCLTQGDVNRTQYKHSESKGGELHKSKCEYRGFAVSG